MKNSAVALVLAGMLTCLLAPGLAGAQMDSRSFGKPIEAAPVDPRIQAAIQQISPERIEQDISTLVSFHNRSTLSSNDKDLPAGQGVLAAADWIEAQFRADSAACGGCLEVKRDTFVQEPGSRIAEPTTLNNIYAVLRGSDPAQASRMYLVTGHYDSRDSSNEDTHGAAPGANDDASGVAVSLESARVLSKLHFPATLVFVAVAGEEQGLYGSAHLAKFAKSRVGTWRRIEQRHRRRQYNAGRHAAGQVRRAGVLRRNSGGCERNGAAHDSHAGRGERFAFAGTGAIDCRRGPNYIKAGDRGRADIPSRAGIPAGQLSARGRSLLL